jgi:hypothetical protein
VLAALALLLAPLAAQDPARVGADGLDGLALAQDEVVVSVGDIPLRRSDVFRVLDLAAPARSAEVIRQMVLTTAAHLDARREGLDVPAALLAREVEAALAEQRARFALEVDESLPLEDYLRLRHGMSPEQHRAEVRRMVLASLLLERAVRLDELRSGYDAVQVAVVEDEAVAREMAGQLAQGASFAVLAKKHSVHPSAARGGDLPPVPPDADAPLLAGQQGLAPGAVLGPEPLLAGEKRLWRLLRLVEHVPATAAPWPELRERVEADLLARPLAAEELAVFEARIMDRYRVTRPTREP